MSQPTNLKCPHCNQAVQAGWSSCRNCGQQLSTQEPNPEGAETGAGTKAPAHPEKKGLFGWLNSWLKR